MPSSAQHPIYSTRREWVRGTHGTYRRTQRQFAKLLWRIHISRRGKDDDGKGLVRRYVYWRDHGICGHCGANSKRRHVKVRGIAPKDFGRVDVCSNGKIDDKSGDWLIHHQRIDSAHIECQHHGRTTSKTIKAWRHDGLNSVPVAENRALETLLWVPIRDTGAQH